MSRIAPELLVSLQEKVTDLKHRCLEFEMAESPPEIRAMDEIANLANLVEWLIQALQMDTRP